MKSTCRSNTDQLSNQIIKFAGKISDEKSSKESSIEYTQLLEEEAVLVERIHMINEDILLHRDFATEAESRILSAITSSKSELFDIPPKEWMIFSR